jgi:hypothetical protein
MAEKTIRELIADKIQADNADFMVKTFSAEKPAIEKVNVFVTQKFITRVPQQAAIRHDIEVFLMIPGATQSAANENKLEFALDKLLTSIASLKFTQWQTAERGTLFENFIGYQVTLEAFTEDTYKP